jgi:hypothetical protein
LSEYQNLVKLLQNWQEPTWVRFQSRKMTAVVVLIRPLLNDAIIKAKSGIYHSLSFGSKVDRMFTSTQLKVTAVPPPYLIVDLQLVILWVSESLFIYNTCRVKSENLRPHRAYTRDCFTTSYASFCRIHCKLHSLRST